MINFFRISSGASWMELGVFVLLVSENFCRGKDTRDIHSRKHTSSERNSSEFVTAQKIVLKSKSPHIYCLRDPKEF